MLATVKKRPKKVVQTTSTEKEMQVITSQVEKNNTKKKKTVRLRHEQNNTQKTGAGVESKIDQNKKSKLVPPAEPKTIVKKRPKMAQKNDVKPELEPKMPVDARVIDVSFEDTKPPGQVVKREVDEERDERINYLTGKGTQHPVHEMIHNLRNILLNSGFNELENSFFLADTDIQKQHNINPTLVFDKVFYLAETPRPTVNLDQEQVEQLRIIKPDIQVDKLNELLNRYKENKIENYQIFQQLMIELNLSTSQLTKMLEILPGLNEHSPKLTNITLRSTMASSWFQTLAAIKDKDQLPIKVFSTGIWFKRGPKLNELKLSSHYGASCIIMDENISVSNGKVITQEILSRLGYKNVKFKESNEFQNFNITTDEIGIYVDDIEITTCGMFSKEVLKKYNIEYPTLYINFGLEHMVMVQKGFNDIRELMFPQFYKAWRLNDAQIAEALQFIRTPKTEVGKAIAQKLVKVCETNGNTPSPCEFKVWEGDIDLAEFTQKTDLAPSETSDKTKVEEGNQSTHPQSTSKSEKRRLSITVFKHEKDSKLCGPAYLNEIMVKNGDIFGVQNNDTNPEFASAQHTNIRYLDAFSKLVGSTIEAKLAEELQDKGLEINIGIIKEMEDINLQLDGGALRYLLTNNKKIDVRGPMFINVDCKLVKANEQKPEST
ncbi:tRNA ligase subunit PheS family protein [[Eubacterium] cellulosolvens]